jgi:hypothetical protein
MAKKYHQYGSTILKTKVSPSTLHRSAQRLPDTSQENLYRELQSSGSIDVPEEYKQTHL